MKNINVIIAASSIFLASCGSSSSLSGTNSDKTDTLTNNTTLGIRGDVKGKMSLMHTAKLGSPIMIKFVVYNNSDSVAQFCKWHTPFEPLISKYLDIVSAQGDEVLYKGPMAKRIMPPPAESYIPLKAGDSLIVDFDVAKAYEIAQPGKYMIKYNATGMSGIQVLDSLNITVAK